MLFILLGLMSDSTYALVAGTIARRVKDRARRVGRRPKWSGLLLIGLGIVAATARRPAPTSS
jgi:threonine/homoserine/homoserine lactone efflux protein